MWLLIHLLIALQDIHVSVQQHHSVHVVRRTLGHHHLRRRRTAAYKITLHFLERVRTDRTSTGTANTYYYYYYCVVSLLSVSLLYEILTVDADRLKQPLSLYAHITHMSPRHFLNPISNRGRRSIIADRNPFSFFLPRDMIFWDQVFGRCNDYNTTLHRRIEHGDRHSSDIIFKNNWCQMAL